MTDPRNDPEPDLSVLRMHREESPGPSRRAGRWRVAVAALLVLALVAAGYLLPLPWFLPRVRTVTARIVSPGEAATVLTATGYTYARDRAAVGAKIIGRVQDLRVEEGDRVREGDTIALLDRANLLAAVREASAAVGEAEATVADARREEGRQRRLLAVGAVSQADYDAAQTRRQVAESRLGVARASLASARAELGYSVILAPLSGVVIERKVEVGEMVAPGGFTSQQSTGAIVRIADLSSLEVEADINESYLARLRLGQPAVVRVDAVPGRDYHGRLRQIVPTADRQRAVVQVKVTIDDRDERLLPDMSCNVTFLDRPPGEGAGADSAAAPERIVVPKGAVLQADGKAAVLRVVDGRIRRTAVQLGPGDATGGVVVTSGLQGGETLVADPAPGLEDGDRVRVKAGG